MKQLFFSAADASLVVPVTAQVKRVIQSRHRPESVYSVRNLTQLVSMADKITTAMTFVLLAVSLVVLLVSGIGIMNIMLATVSARIREIGIRKAIGATNREIRFQFLSEAILISLIGGVLGIIVGLAIPFSVRFFTEYRIPIQGFRNHRDRRFFARRRSLTQWFRSLTGSTRCRKNGLNPAIRILRIASSRSSGRW